MQFALAASAPAGRSESAHHAGSGKDQGRFLVRYFIIIVTGYGKVKDQPAVAFFLLE
jgi:hypothetical protein